MLDLVIEFEDEGKKSGAMLDYKYPVFSYVYNMKHVKLLNDNDLMSMFDRLSKKKVIDIYVGIQDNPNPLYELVLQLREQNNAEVGKMMDNHVNDMLENENEVGDIVEDVNNVDNMVEDCKNQGNEGVDSDSDSEYIGESEFDEENGHTEESVDDEASVHSAGSEDDDKMLFDRNNNGEEIVGKYGGVVNSQPKKNRGRPKVEKPTTSVAPKKRQVKKYTNMGAGLYIDPKTGKTYLNGFLIQSRQAPSHGGESSNPATTVILSQDGPSATQSNEME
ncbi:hypothetical protein ACET3Z_021929 [Daucus carota]